MGAATKDITIEQHADYLMNVTLKQNATTALNITGYSIYSTARTAYGATAKWFDFTIVVTDAVNGKFDAKLTAAQTAGLTQATSGVYDVLLVAPGGQKQRVFQGKITISRSVTQV
jgi:hypothetical protein